VEPWIIGTFLDESIFLFTILTQQGINSVFHLLNFHCEYFCFIINFNPVNVYLVLVVRSVVGWLVR